MMTDTETLTAIANSPFDHGANSLASVGLMDELIAQYVGWIALIDFEYEEPTGVWEKVKYVP
jgi:hypothetical protein